MSTKKDTNLEKHFKHYVAETKVEYKYTLKFAVPEMTNEMIDSIEAALKKYELKSASAFRSTPIQENPLDFPNIKNMPVHSTEIVVGYPSSVDFLRVLMGNTVGISTGQIAVYTENDPRQVETDLFLMRKSPDFKEDYVAILDPDHPDYDKDATVARDDSSMFGAGYNVPFLQELERVRKEREITTVTNSLIPGEKIDHSTLPSGYDKFNDSLSKEDNIGLFGRVKASTNIKVGTL